MAAFPKKNPAPRANAGTKGEVVKLRVGVPDFQYLDAASRQLAIETVSAALMPCLQMREVALAYAQDDSAIYGRATRRLIKIVAGIEPLPSGDMPPLKLVKCGRCLALDEAADRVVENIIINSLLPLVPSLEVAKAVGFDYGIIFAASRIIMERHGLIQKRGRL
jgi:hypothetical protein